MNEELLLKMRDPKFYLENFVKIKTKAGGLHPFILNEAQKDFLNTIRKHNRVMILKARQLGFSTGVSGYIYHSTIMNPGITSALIGYNSDLVTELLDKIHTFIRTTPEEIRPEIKYQSKYEISFPRIDSKILILPSTENVGSGYTLNLCLLTELPKIKDAEEKMASLMPAIPLNGKFIIEASPKGMGNIFHRMWMDDTNGWIKKRYGWRWGYSEKEIEAIKKQMNDPQMFAQEYDLTFLSSGRSVFDPEIILQQRKNVLKVGDKVDDENTVYEDNGWRIYKNPKDDGLFVCGVDVSEGVRGGDYSVAVIWDRKTGEEVAMFRGFIAPDRFGNELNRVGRIYNNAFMVVEINNQGILTVNTLKQLCYPSMYFRPAKFESISTKITDRLGWRTTSITRPILIGDFNQAIRDGDITIHSKELLDEMDVFIYDDNNNMVPIDSTWHDDTIFSAALGVQGFKVMYAGELKQLDEQLFLPKTFSY